MGIHFLLLFAFLLIMQCLHFSCSTNISCHEIERQSLLKFRKGLIDESNRLSSWVGNDCCTWQGVGCRKTTGSVVKLDLRNPLSYDPAIIFWSYNWNRTLTKSLLGGEVNPSLLNLKHLNYLDLSWNNFSGAIPKFFGSFKDLRYLNLSCSGFLGKVPHHLGNLSSLEYLDLASIYLLPPSVGVMIDNLRWASTLSSLKHLDLSGVEGFGEDSDWFLVVNKFPSLKVLNLAWCGIQSIPPSPNVNFTSLATLDLSHNINNSTIPLWLSNISGLMHLNLRFNNFHGPIPDSLGMLSFLTVLDLSHNFINSAIPLWLSNISGLTHLQLQANKFHGPIPESLGMLSFLTVLVLFDNAFSLSIPESLCNLSSLEYLGLSHNLLSGSIPTSIGQLSKLKELHISHNQLSGNIPTSFGHLSKLQSLDVSYNSLVGNLSEHHFTELEKLDSLYMSSTSLGFNVRLQWVPPFQLSQIYMDSCKNIGPQFPQWLQTQRHIDQLSIGNSSISDSIPNWFENVSSLIRLLDLSHNKIHGKFPKFQESVVGPLVRQLILHSNRFEGPLTVLPSDVEVLDLSTNLLTGNIPFHICMMKSLYVIDLSGNKLSGRLPSCLGRLISLQVLDVTNNNLHGHIPSSLGSLSQLQSLHLHNNRFEGELPLSLQNLTSLMTLDLGVNFFIGIIPPWIGEKLSNLQLLSLQSNLFAGEIPLQLCYLIFLRLLDLSNNNVTGNIPHCISKLTGMTIKSYSDGNYSRYYTENIFVVVKGTELRYTQTIKFLTSIDLSNNNMVGEIPKGLMDLSGLEALNISGNQLNGRIPKTIGNLKQLESLDLSRNKLSGPIPPSLSDLNFLSYLNLSFNELSGQIPTGHQLQTLTDPTIYEGNSELCGAPILKSCSRNDEPLAHGSEASDDSDHLWFYAGIGPGFLVGFLGFFGVLHFKESWRHAYFQFLENVFNWLALAITIKLAWLQKKFGTCEV